MKTTTTSPLALATAPSGPSLVEEAFEALAESFAQFCLMVGTESLTQMMGCDMTRLAAVRRALKQARELNDAEKAERLIRNLARRFAQRIIGIRGGRIAFDVPTSELTEDATAELYREVEPIPGISLRAVS